MVSRFGEGSAPPDPTEKDAKDCYATSKLYVSTRPLNQHMFGFRGSLDLLALDPGSLREGPGGPRQAKGWPWGTSRALRDGPKTLLDCLVCFGLS